MANDPFELWCGARRLARLEPERKQERPLSRLHERFLLAERRLNEGEHNISQQETVIRQLKREGRDLALALAVLDTLIETQKALFQERDLIVAQLAMRFG